MSEDAKTYTFNDIQQVSTRKVTAEGFLQADAYMSKVGIAEYTAAEFPHPELYGAENPSDIIRVYRPPEALFNSDTLDSYKNKPVTNGHPLSGAVTTKNAKREQVGHIGDSVIRDGNSIKGRLTITDEESIQDIQAGKFCLSVGYDGTIVPKQGMTDSGEKFDAILMNMRGNHVALTSTPRAGHECKLLDEIKSQKTGGRKMAKINIRGIDVDINEEAHQAVSTIVDENKSLATSVSTLNDSIDALKKEKDVLQAQLDELKVKINDSSAVELKITERFNLIDSVRAHLPGFDFANKTFRDINVALINRFYDGFLSDDKSDEYIQARKDAILESCAKQSSSDPYGAKRINNNAVAMTDSSTAASSVYVKARAEAIAKQSMEWKGGLK